MAILQISKIQQRSGNLVDLPQLDDAEFGWANDAKRLFIGKTTPNENVEILTSYSQISFSQIDGAVGNLNVSNVTIANGQVLTYDGTNWVNRGGDAGGLITLGDVSNVKITGGAVGYVLQTDGTGNLSWTPKGTLVAGILNVSKANPAVVTTVSDNFFTNASQVTILDPQGMTQLAGNIYYANVLTSTTFELYSDDTLSTSVNSTGYNTYSYTTVSATTVSTNEITVANSSPFTVGSAVKFIGDMSTSNISNTETYYVLSKPSTTKLKIATSSDANTSNVVPLQTTSGLTAEVYQIDGQAVATTSSAITFSPAGGSDTQIQYNESGSLQGNSAFTYDYGNSLLSLNGNANIGNVNTTGVVTASRLISNVATGTAPLVVSSTTQVANLNSTFAGTVITAAQPNITSVGTLTSLAVSGGITASTVWSNNNGNGTNFRVGDDAWIGDINITNTIAIRGQQDAANGYIIFGNADTTSTLGRAGSGPLTYNGAFVAVGNITGANLVTGGVLSVTGNANVGNLGTAGLITATGNVTGGNLVTGGALNVTGNANTGNLGTATLIATTGNITTINSGLLQNGNSNVTITANGNVTIAAVGGARITATSTGANITGTLGVSGNANVGNLGTAGLITATGNVSGGNLTTAGVVAATGNVSGGNLTTAGALSVTGNANVGNIGATAGVFTGNVTAGNVYANSGTVGANVITGNLVGGTLTTAAQPNITSVGTLSSLTVSGNANISGNINFTGAKANLGSNANVTLTGGSSGQLLATDGSGNLSWVSQGSVIGGAAGSNTQVQYNALGLLAASANFTFNYLSNALTVGGNITGSNIVATNYNIRSITTGITAAGSTQGTATALTKEINVISTVSSGANGVILPTAVAGMVLIVNNTSANTVNVYPATGGAINSGSTNAAYSHSSGASIQYYATSSTQWYTVGATFA